MRTAALQSLYFVRTSAAPRSEIKQVIVELYSARHLRLDLAEFLTERCSDGGGGGGGSGAVGRAGNGSSGAAVKEGRKVNHGEGGKGKGRKEDAPQIVVHPRYRLHPRTRIDLDRRISLRQCLLLLPPLVLTPRLRLSNLLHIALPVPLVQQRRHLPRRVRLVHVGELSVDRSEAIKIVRANGVVSLHPKASFADGGGLLDGFAFEVLRKVLL
jgi:hypothetical protein